MLALDSFEKITRIALVLGSSEKLVFSLALH